MIILTSVFSYDSINFMRKDIHPAYYKNAKITCSCGKQWIVGSTRPEMRIELCSNCHPFYTGKKKLVDTARKVERFKARAIKTQALKNKLVKQKRLQKKPAGSAGKPA